MQCRRSCRNSCSIHVFVLPTDVCTHVLYTLIVTVHFSFLSARSQHRIHPGDTPHTHTHDTRHITQSQMLSSGSPTKNKEDLLEEQANSAKTHVSIKNSKTKPRGSRRLLRKTVTKEGRRLLTREGLIKLPKLPILLYLRKHACL